MPFSFAAPFPRIALSLALGVVLLPALPARTEASPLEAALEATVRLVRDGSTGTGFVVATNRGEFLVTAEHFFTERPGDECEVVYRSRDEAGKVVRSVRKQAIRDGEKPLWTAHPKEDVAVLPIQLPEDSVIVPVPLSRIATAAEISDRWMVVGDSLHVPCYPIGTEANVAGWPVLRSGMVATHPLAPVADHPTFFVDMSSFGGESGAPAILRQGDRWRVVGVVVGMQRQTEQTRTPLEEKTTHLPLGLAITVQSALLWDILPEE